MKQPYIFIALVYLRQRSHLPAFSRNEGPLSRPARSQLMHLQYRCKPCIDTRPGRLAQRCEWSNMLRHR